MTAIICVVCFLIALYVITLAEAATERTMHEAYLACHAEQIAARKWKGKVL